MNQHLSAVQKALNAGEIPLPLAEHIEKLLQAVETFVDPSLLDDARREATEAILVREATAEALKRTKDELDQTRSALAHRTQQLGAIVLICGK